MIFLLNKKIDRKLREKWLDLLLKKSLLKNALKNCFCLTVFTVQKELLFFFLFFSLLFFGVSSGRGRFSSFFDRVN